MNKGMALKRRLIILLSALFVLCFGFFAVNAINNKKASATEFSEWFFEGGSSYWNYYEKNSNTMFNVGDHGIVFSIYHNPMIAISSGGVFDVTFTPLQTGITPKAMDVPGQFTLHFWCYNNADYGCGCYSVTGYFPGAAYGDAWQVKNYLSNSEGGNNYENITVRIYKTGDVWNMYINDVDASEQFRNSVGSDFMTAGATNVVVSTEGMNGALRTGTIRQITADEISNLSAIKMLDAYTASDTNAYIINENNYLSLSAHGGQFTLNLNAIERPWNADGYSYENIFSVAVASNSAPQELCYYDGSGTSFGGDTGRFYVNVKYTNDRKVYVAPHFYAGQADDYLEIGSYTLGVNGALTFSFMPVVGGWSFKLTYNGNTFNYTELFQQYVQQSVFLSDGYINFGCHGYLTGPNNQNQINAYYSSCNGYSGYQTRTDSTSVGEVLYNSPVNSMNYYGDYLASGEKAYLGYTNTAFQFYGKVSFVRAITDADVEAGNNVITVRFGDEENIVAPTDSGANHFGIQLKFQSNGAIYASLLYYNEDSSSWGNVYDKDILVGGYNNTAGDYIFSLRIRRVYAATHGEQIWGVYFNGYLLDTYNFNYLVTRAGDGNGFMQIANKNVMAELSSANGFVTFPGSFYIMSIVESGRDAVNSATTVSVSDLTATDGTDLITDSLTVSTEAAYLYSATAATATNDISFKFTFTYNASNTFTVILRANGLSATNGAYVTIDGDIIIMGGVSSSSIDDVRRPNTLTDGTTYTVTVSVLTLTEDSSKSLVTFSAVDANNQYKAVLEQILSVGTEVNYGIAFSASADTVIGTTLYRTAFAGTDGAIVSYARSVYGETGPDAPVAEARTNYTAKWILAGSDVTEYVKGSVTSSAKYNLYYMFGNQTDIAAVINSGNSTKYDNTVKIVLDFDDSENATPAILFINYLNTSFLNTLETAITNEEVDSYEIYTLYKAGDLAADALTFENCDEYHKSVNEGGYLNTDNNVTYVGLILDGITSAHYANVITSRLCIKINYVIGGTSLTAYFYSNVATKGSINTAANNSYQDGTDFFSAAELEIINTFRA